MKGHKYYLKSQIHKDVENGASESDNFFSRRNIIICSIIFALLLVGILAILIGGNRNLLNGSRQVSKSKFNSKSPNFKNFKLKPKSPSNSTSDSDLDVDPVDLLIRPIASNGLIIFKRKREEKKKAWNPFSYEPEVPVCSDFWTIHPDGTNLKQLNIAGIEKHADLCNISLPTYSNDGNMIAFINELKDGQNDLYIMNSDGKNLEKFQINQNIYYFNFSSNDKEILFQTRHNNETKILAVNIKDKTTITTKFRTKFKSLDLLTLTHNKKFVLGIFEFEEKDEGMEKREFLVLNAKTGKIQSHFPINCLNHVISPDGKKIACIYGGKEVFGVVLDIADQGKSKPYFIRGFHNFRSFKWSPDGKLIALEASKEGGGGIFSIECDKHIKNPSYDFYADEKALAIGETPNWQPVPRYYDRN